MTSMFRSSVSSGASSSDDDDHVEVGREPLEVSGDHVFEHDGSRKIDESKGEDEEFVGEDDAKNGHDQHAEEVTSSENSFENGAGPLARLTPLNRNPEHHSALLLISLIEERSRKQAAMALNEGRKVLLPETHPEVCELARPLFIEMAKELHKAGVLPEDFSGQHLEKLRAQYLNAYELASQKIATRLLNDSQSAYIDDGSDIFDRSNTISASTLDLSRLGNFDLQFTPAALDPDFLNLASLIYRGCGAQALPVVSTYLAEYKELSFLGGGAFGKVYKAQNHLDQQEWAVKQIVISADWLQQLMTLRQEDMAQRINNKLKEVRVLASLDHVNIVRYHHVWLESCPPGSKKTAANGESGEYYDTALVENIENRVDKQDLSVPKSLVMRGRSISSVDEEVTRNPLVPFDVVVNIKMSVHPMTLEDLLWPKEKEIQHCFHVGPSARLLLAILDGVEYMHGKRYIHRDLKPANILLSIQNAMQIREKDGQVDITACSECGYESTNPDMHTFITPHISDFGLVADYIPEGDPNVPPLAIVDGSTHLPLVGTKHYRPTTDREICPKLDVYSLGIIAFELVYAMSTKSERLIVLGQLQDGVIPSEFKKNHPMMAKGILHMVSDKREEQWSCTEVRAWLEDILKKHA